MDSEWNGPDLRLLIERLGLSFSDEALLHEALTHASYANEHRGTSVVRNNERLEILGDAVIGLVVIDVLMDTLPEAREGEITGRKSYLVCNEALADIAEEVGLTSYLRASRGVRHSGERARRYRGACALEALIGAIYRDQGFLAARMYVEHMILRNLREAIRADVRSPKGRLQEYTQAQGSGLPTYQVVEKLHEDGKLSVTVAVFLDGVEVARGKGSNKKLASKHAALTALNVLKEGK